jgi:hypothetical protein
MPPKRGRLPWRPLWTDAPGNSQLPLWLAPYGPNILGKRVTTQLHYDIEPRDFGAEPEDDRNLTGPLGIC